MQNRYGSTVVSQYDYRYDAIGRRTSVETSGSQFGQTPRFTAWGYDERNQVTGSNRYTGSFTASPNPANEVGSERRGYIFDPIGNRESALGQDGTTSVSYTPNELNQYGAVGQLVPSYDDDGNLLNDGTKLLVYNAENQLVRVEVSGASVSTYDYDYIGRRVRKSVDLVSGDDYVVSWVYSGWNKIEERKTVGSTTTVKNFVWGLDLSQSVEGAGGVGGLLASVDASGTSLFSYDGNGNVSELIAASTGSVAAHYEYDAFGNSLVATGPLAAENPYRFSTKYLDGESGLYYYTFRFYDPSLGRWTQRDPIEEEGGLNLHAFVGNNAIAYWDYLGLEHLIHATLPEYAASIVRSGLKAGTDGVIWLSSPNIAGSGASARATVHLLYDLATDGAREIPECVIKDAQKAANAALKGSGLSGAERGAAFGRLKGNAIADWVRKQPEQVFKMKAPPPYAGTHYVFKEAGLRAASPNLLRVSGAGTEGAIRIMFNNERGFLIPGKYGRAIRIGGRVMFLAATAASTYEIYTAENRLKTTTAVVGGWTGAAAGFRVGATGGAALATALGQAGPQVATPEEVVTVPALAVAGGLAGGALGMVIGTEVATTTYEWAFERGFQQ